MLNAMTAIVSPNPSVVSPATSSFMRTMSNPSRNPVTNPSAIPATMAAANGQPKFVVSTALAYPPMPASAACATDSGPDDIVMYSPSAMMLLMPAVMRTGVQKFSSSDIVGAEKSSGLEDEHDHEHP